MSLETQQQVKFASVPTMDYNYSTTENMTDSIDEITYLPYWAVDLRNVILVLISIVGIIGNCMIIVAVAFSKKLQTTTNVFVSNLAVTDLLTCCSVIIFWFCYALTHRLNEICRFLDLSLVSSIAISIYFFGVIGIHRLILITKPHLCGRIFTSWKLVIFIALLWIIPGGSVCVRAVLFYEIEFDSVYKSCRWVKTHERAADLERIWYAFGAGIPTTAVIVSYSWIFIHIKKHFKTQKQHLINLRTIDPKGLSSVSRPQESVVSEAQITVINPRIKKISRQQIQISKNLFLVLCAFFVSYTPSLLYISTYKVAKPSPAVNDIEAYLKLLIYASSAFNFFIYASRHPDFKIVLGQMMRCSYSKIPQPSRLLKFLLSKKN